MPAGRDGTGQPAGHLHHPAVRWVQEVAGDQVEGPALGRERPRVDLPEVDAVSHPGLLGVPGGAGQAVGREIRAGDLPALLGQPDHVAALAAADVERGARRQFRHLGDELRVGLPAPDLLRAGVALVPARRFEHGRRLGLGLMPVSVPAHRATPRPVAAIRPYKLLMSMLISVRTGPRNDKFRCRNGKRTDAGHPRSGHDRAMGSPLHNRDVDWDRWPVTDYLDEIYRDVAPDDDAVLVHHSAFYRRFPPGHFARSLELGAGPNLYPLMLTSAVSRD